MCEVRPGETITQRFGHCGPRLRTRTERPSLPYDCALPMDQIRRVTSGILLGAGIALVLAGLSAALGSTIPAILASLAVVAALLFAGGVWFSDRQS